ncbi:MAG: CxxxxCH/CxxCH domain-containing protein [Candidatus Deferrimicrobiaceae bacterium]
MTVPIHSFRDLRHSAMSLILLAAFAGIAGCGTDNSSTGMISPPDWVVLPSGGQHATSATLTYIANGGSSSCIECHGADLSGGNSTVSCFGNPLGCHHGPVADWVVSPPAAQNHGVAAKKAPGSSGFASCQICHASDFTGGGAGVSCFLCHTPPHPDDWRLFDVYKHTDTDQANAPVCAQCHLNGNNSPIGAPSPPAPAGTSPGCFNNTLCHGTDTTHAVPFLAHTGVTEDTFNDPFPDGCSACHAITGVSPSSVAPLCTVCHQGGSPLTSLDCTSCHGDPPSGAAYPDVAGQHAVHGALPGVVECNPCHNGLDADTPEHYDRANARSGNDALRVPPGDVAFLGYDAQSGTASFNATNRTCSNVICHGGQATPDWQTATADAIDVPNACPSCHVSGTTQYNSYYSGRHDRHITVFGLSAETCKLCHDEAMVNVTGHFQNLATPTFEQRPIETILPDVRYNGTSCDPNKGGLTGCHRKKDW